MVEKIEKPKEQIEGLESSSVLRRRTFSHAPSDKIWKKWSPFGTNREFDDADFVMAHNDIFGP